MLSDKLRCAAGHKRIIGQMHILTAPDEKPEDHQAITIHLEDNVNVSQMS